MTQEEDGGEIHPLCKKINKDALKEIRSQLSNIINTRDDFAHGRIYFLGEKPKLKFFRNGMQEIELTEKYLDTQLNIFNYCHSNLITIQKVLSYSLNKK